MSNLYFSWTSDADDDGTPETERYSSIMYLPDIEEPDGGRKLAIQSATTLGGEVLLQSLRRTSAFDHRLPGKFTLRWEVAEEALLLATAEDYARDRIAQVRLDHRWRQLEVISHGVTRKALVYAGYLLHTNGDTYWLATDTEVTADEGDTHIIATPNGSDGTLTIGHVTSVPAEGSWDLATVSTSATLVTVLSDPTGVANARTVRILDRRTIQVRRGLWGLELDLQEVR